MIKYNHLKSVLLVAVLATFLSSCTGTKFLREGETFYAGADIKFEQQGRVGRKRVLRKELETLITPKPNGKFLGSRPGVWFYFVAGNPEKEKGIGNFIRKKLGKAPVLLSDATPERTATLLSGYLNNEGYFKSDTEVEIKTRRKESTAVYTIRLYPPYRLKEITFPKGRDSTYAAIMQTLHEKSLLKTGQRYELDMLQAEQARIEEEVENFGFFYFDDRYLIFEADSTVGEKEVDLRLRLEPGIPQRAKRIYRLNSVKVFPNYSLSRDTTTIPGDTLELDGFTYIDNKKAFRPRVITRVINLRKGDIYTREAQDLTLSHLMGLGTFKFVNIKFRETYEDSTLLNAAILLTPLHKKSLRGEVQAVSKSNNFVGPGMSFTFTNRNFLGGAELFELKLNASYEVQVSRQLERPLNAFEFGVESSLTVPRFISPIRIDYNSKKYLPKTQFRVGFNVQNRVRYFRLNSFNVAAGYTWKESPTRMHELFPIDLNYVRTDNTSLEFDSLLLRNTLLANSFENQFIVGSRYSYTLNTQLKEDPLDEFQPRKIREHNFYFNGNIDIAGNALRAIQRQVKEGEGPYQIFGSPYSQYIKGDVDFRYYWQLDSHNKLVSRIVFGTGYAYGNSTTMPYIKQFSIGGTNSIRAFPARSIGPGTYDVRTQADENDQRLFIDQRGDIKLEGNLEYRFDIYKAFKGALFLDAGNIWLLEEDDHRPGGRFKRDQFLKELAVGTGVGFRFDFSFFVLRLDVATPLRKPFLPEDQRWVIKDIDFSSSKWRQNNIIFNIAIGYPF